MIFHSNITQKISNPKSLLVNVLTNVAFVRQVKLKTKPAPEIIQPTQQELVGIKWTLMIFHINITLKFSNSKSSLINIYICVAVTKPEGIDCFLIYLWVLESLISHVVPRHSVSKSKLVELEAVVPFNLIN